MSIMLPQGMARGGLPAKVKIGGRSCVLDALPHPDSPFAGWFIANANGGRGIFDEPARLFAADTCQSAAAVGSPLLSLVDQVRSRGATINKYRVELSRQSQDGNRLVDIF